MESARSTWWQPRDSNHWGHLRQNGLHFRVPNRKIAFFGLCCYCFANKYAGFVGIGARDSPAGAQPQRGPRHAHVSTPVRAWLPGMSVLGLPRLDQFMFMAAPPGVGPIMILLFNFDGASAFCEKVATTTNFRHVHLKKTCRGRVLHRAPLCLFPRKTRRQSVLNTPMKAV